MLRSVNRPASSESGHEVVAPRTSANDGLRRRFEAEVVDQGAFSQDWFCGSIEPWEPMMEVLEDRRARVLEIGSFEGLSASYVLWRLPDARITCVDTFAGGAEYVAGDQLPEAGLQAAFDANTALIDGSRVRKLVGESKRVLADLGAEGSSFDFVYVDGSHRALDVLVDAALSWPLIAVDGFLVFDDYASPGLGEDPLLRPGPAIDAFLALVADKHELVFNDWQLAVRKTVA